MIHSLLVNKSQVFYSDDSLNLMCASLSTNCLKWTGAFLGDTLMLDHRCKYDKPLRCVAMNFDWPKVLLFFI